MCARCDPTCEACGENVRPTRVVADYTLCIDIQACLTVVYEANKSRRKSE